MWHLWHRLLLNQILLQTNQMSVVWKQIEIRSLFSKIKSTVSNNLIGHPPSSKHPFSNECSHLIMSAASLNLCPYSISTPKIITVWPHRKMTGLEKSVLFWLSDLRVIWQWHLNVECATCAVPVRETWSRKLKDLCF